MGYVDLGTYWVRAVSKSGRGLSIQEPGPGRIFWVPALMVEGASLGAWSDLRGPDWLRERLNEVKAEKADDGLRVYEWEEKRPEDKKPVEMPVCRLGQISFL